MTKLDPKKVKKDPVYFVEKIIGMKLPSYQKKWLKLTTKHKRLCFMAFRTSGKTRQLIIHHALWRAVTEPGTSYLFISNTLPQAIQVLKDLRLTILMNPFLKTIVPSNRSKAWSRTEIELDNHSTIKAKAYNENVRGEHVDGVYCDEIGEYDDHEVLKKAILPTIRAKRGNFTGLGTPKSELDLLHEIERDPGFASIYFDRFPAEGEKGDLFLERFKDVDIVHKEDSIHIVDKKSQKMIETYNYMTWSQEFLLKPVSLKDKLFPDHLISACMDNTATFQNGVVNMRQYFMGVDFAMSASSGSDFTVIVVLEKAPGDKRLKIVHIERFKGLDYVLQKERIKELAERYQVIKVLGDEGSFGKVFIYDLRAEGLPIDGYKFTYQSGSKDELIKALRDQFEKKGFIIPFGEDPLTRVNVNVLLDELSKFGIIFDYRTHKVKFEGTGKHDDCVIALALANFIARHISMATFEVIKGSQKGRNPFIMQIR